MSLYNKLEMVVEKRVFLYCCKGAFVVIQHSILDSSPGLAATDELLIQVCEQHAIGRSFRPNRVQKKKKERAAYGKTDTHTDSKRSDGLKLHS